MNFNIIDEKRKQQRYTVTGFCVRVGIDRSTYYGYLKNPSQMSVAVLEAMQDTLGLSAEDMQKVLS